MAEALVSDILKQLASIAAREPEQGIGLVVGIEEEVGRLENHLQTIMPMLNDAEKQQVNWLDDLIDACYEIDDVLDEWNTAIIKSKIEIEEENAENAPVLNDKVSFFNPYGPINFFLPRIVVIAKVVVFYVVLPFLN